MENNVRRLQPPPPAKRQSAQRPRASRKAAAALTLVESAGDGSETPSAPNFLEFELARLAALSLALRSCDLSSDLEFRMFVERSAQSENTGLERRDIAAELFIAPITLQRWSRGESLPFPVPRKAYLASLADLVDDYASRLQQLGLAALLDVPRRGARKNPAKR